MDQRLAQKRRPVLFMAAFLLGAPVGLGLYLLHYAAAFSYFSNDPMACINCHVMRDQFENWNHSSHKAFAVCNDCHTPKAFADKWIVKGINGWNHSVAFTTGNFPDPIHINKMNSRVVQSRCVSCHETLVSAIHRNASGEERLCFDCHKNVGH